MRILAAFWGTLFPQAVSPLHWIDKVMEEVGKKVGRMLNEEPLEDRMRGRLEKRLQLKG